MIRYALPIWAFCVLLSCSPTPSERERGPRLSCPFLEIQSGFGRGMGWAEPQGEEARSPVSGTAEPARLVTKTQSRPPNVLRACSETGSVRAR